MIIRIVVVGPQCWGSGRTLQQAVAKCRNNWPSFYRSEGMPYNAYEASEDFQVDDMGTITAQSLKKIREVRFDNGVKSVKVEGFDSVVTT